MLHLVPLAPSLKFPSTQGDCVLHSCFGQISKNTHAAHFAVIKLIAIHLYNVGKKSTAVICILKTERFLSLWILSVKSRHKSIVLLKLNVCFWTIKTNS